MSIEKRSDGTEKIFTVKNLFLWSKKVCAAIWIAIKFIVEWIINIILFLIYVIGLGLQEVFMKKVLLGIWKVIEFVGLTS